MSFSRLLRKFSQPNLTRPASADAASSLSPDASDEPPQRRQASEPMPLFPRAWRRKRRRSTAGHSSLSLPTSTSSPPATPKGESHASIGGSCEMPVPMPLPVPSSVSPLNLSVAPLPEVKPVRDKLAEAWDAVKEDPNIAKRSRELDAIGDTIDTVQNNAAPFVPIIKATVAAVEQADISKAIKDGIDKFSEGMPVLMKALDELKALHPFIGVVVLAFKTVYTLEQKRRDNDKKIIALYAGMKDMMGALLLLRGMENDKLIAPDGTSIEDRLRSLVDHTAEDIKDCSNVCDTYMKKRLLAKVLLSSVWDAKLLDFVKLFVTRREEFEFELTMHTSQGVDKANVKLDVIGDTTREINEQMNVMKALFEQFISPEQKRLSELVAAKGGLKACKDDDKILLELDKATGKGPSAPKADGGRARREQHKDTNLSADDLRRDVLEDPGIAAGRNLMVFSRKFDAQKNQIVDELTLVFKRESDRVVRELKGGAHERILDKSIHEIWKEMGWRGNVKARHFVLALRDHYLEKLALRTESILGIGTTNDTVSDPDAWAIKYIDIMRLQPIMEAFDDDASGFITIGEMNRFTSSRPVDWSLPHWVAFWAVGYKASIIDYANKIQELFAKMDGIRAEVHPLNRQAIIRYFTNVWIPVHELVTAVLSLEPVEDDLEKFKPHVEAEEARLANNLRAVDYIIDGTDTLTLITGVGRIEKTVFPLLYLLMKRHYEIMRVMRTKVLDLNVLVEGMKSMYYVRDAITYRVDDLTSNFSQQKLDMERQFQNFAYGMFKYFNDPKTLWSAEYVQNLDPPITPYNDANEDQEVNPEDILKLQSTDEPSSLDYWVYDGHSIDDIPTYRDVEPPLKDLLGHWHGYFYGDEGAREAEGTDSMMTFVLESAEGERNFKANGWSNRGRFTITGSWYEGDKDITQIKFKMSFHNSFWSSIFFYFNGHFDPERDALTGIWGYSAELEGSISPMEFRRIAPRYLTVYPSIKELSDNKPRSLWKFAISAVQNDIRQKHWSWSYFSQRRDDRETVVTLTVRYYFFGKPIGDEEGQKLRAAAQRLTSADACFYGSMVHRNRAYTLAHDNAYCDSCGGFIGGVRLLCLDCDNTEGDAKRTLDLCCAPESRCIDARVTHREDLQGPHEPDHKLVKLRTPVLVHQYGRMYQPARKAFERVEELCTKITRASRSPQEKLESGKDAREASSLDLTTTEELSTSVKRDGVLSVEDGTKNGTEAKPTTTKIPSKGDKLEDVPTAVNDTLDGAEAEPMVTEVSSESDKPDDVPAAADVPSAVNGTEDRVEVEPTVTATPSKSVEPNGVLVVPDGTKDEVEAEEQEGKAPPSAAQAQGKDTDLPTCGNCNGPLSFPFWHCIYCKDDLFICDACDTDGVPELMRSSGKHTEDHHVIRCLVPAKGDDATPATEERLISIEGRLDSVHARFNDLGGRIDDLTSRIGNIEQLLYKLTGISGTGAAKL